MNLTLYTHPVSPASQKVRLALCEKCLDWERRDVDLPNKEVLEPWYLELNPMGVLPTLTHDGHAVTESSVILEYLEDAFPEPSLRPNSPAALARMRWWMGLVDDRLHYSAGALIWTTLMRPAMLEKSDEEQEALLARVPDLARRARHRRWVEHGIEGPDFRDAILTFRATFDRMNTALVESRWLADDEFTLADCALIPYVQAMDQMGWSGMFEAEHPLLADWFARAKMRPSFQQAILDELPEAGLAAARQAGATVQDRLMARFAAAA